MSHRSRRRWRKNGDAYRFTNNNPWLTQVVLDCPTTGRRSYVSRKIARKRLRGYTRHHGYDYKDFEIVDCQHCGYWHFQQRRQRGKDHE